jgi:hypothetical protein
MTNEEINKIIAEFRGWKYEFNGNDEDPEWYWIPPNNPDGNGTPPDYCNDLNAMHEAEKMLNEKQEDIMNSTLWDIMDGRKYLWHSTASQRAKAFVITIEKWKK